MKQKNDQDFNNMIIESYEKAFILQDIKRKYYNVLSCEMDLMDLFIFLPMETVKQIQKDMDQELKEGYKYKE